jgi:AraC-like DNA-binding protein
MRPYEGFRFDGGARRSWIEAAQLPVTLIVDLGEPLVASGRRLPEAWLAGPTAAPEVVELGPGQTTLDVKLSPLGSFRLLGIPTREIAHRVVGLDDLFGPAGRRLTEQIVEAKSWEGRFRLVDAFLSRRVDEAPRTTPVVEEAWLRLCRSCGRLPIGRLATELQISRRHLGNLFKEEVGLSPKTVARLLRFTEASGRMRATPENWASIALDCGYSDQSHLNREFRDFSGTTPGDFLARRL